MFYAFLFDRHKRANVQLLAFREIRARIVGTYLGFGHYLLLPLLLILIYSFVFTTIFSVRWGSNDAGFGSFALRVFIGLIAFNFFAEVINRSPSATSRLVDGLVRRRLVERRVEEEDRRQRTLQLTPRGAALLRVVDRARADQFLSAVRPMPTSSIYPCSRPSHDAIGGHHGAFDRTQSVIICPDESTLKPLFQVILRLGQVAISCKPPGNN